MEIYYIFDVYMHNDSIKNMYNSRSIDNVIWDVINYNDNHYPRWCKNVDNIKCITCYYYKSIQDFIICIECKSYTCIKCAIICKNHNNLNYYCINCRITDKYNVYCSICLINNNYDLKKYNKINNINNIVPEEYSVGNTHQNIIRYNKDKYNKYMNALLNNINEEYEFIIANKSMEVKKFISLFAKKFYPDAKLQKNDLTYNAESMHYIIMNYSLLLYNKYKNFFDSIICD